MEIRAQYDMVQDIRRIVIASQARSVSLEVYAKTGDLVVVPFSARDLLFHITGAVPMYSPDADTLYDLQEFGVADIASVTIDDKVVYVASRYKDDFKAELEQMYPSGYTDEDMLAYAGFLRSQRQGDQAVYHTV